MQLLEHIVDLQTESTTRQRESLSCSYHSLRELPNPVSILLLVQRFLFPFLDEGGILDLLPPIWFLPNGIRESTHPHFGNLAPTSFSGQIGETWGGKEKPHCSWMLLALMIGIVPGLTVEWVDVVAAWERVVGEAESGNRSHDCWASSGVCSTR